MKVLSGVYPYGTYSGQIVYEGEECRFNSIRESERAGIVIIHQELALIPELSHHREPLPRQRERQARGDRLARARASRAIELLARVGLDEDPDTIIKNIGIGKQQLVEIAKALAKDVKLLILDEPTAALNDADSQHLLSLLDGLRDQGITSIMISHKLNEIEQISDSITIIRDGRTIETLDVERRRRRRGPDHPRDGRPRPRPPLPAARRPNLGETLLEIRDWTVAHPADPHRVVVNNANLTVRRGEIVGLAGLMGAGRTELARSVFGQSYGTKLSGTLLKHGKEIRAKTVQQAIDAGLAYVTEDRKALGLNLLDTIRVSITSAGLKKIRKGLVVDDNQEVLAADQYRDSRIKAPDVEEGVGKLSGGNQQKVVLGKWMFTEPDVLILDEPTRGIDVGAKYEIYEIINQLADSGRGVLVISSELPELLGICDRIYTLSAGVITAEVPRERRRPGDAHALHDPEKGRLTMTPTTTRDAAPKGGHRSPRRGDPQEPRAATSASTA